MEKLTWINKLQKGVRSSGRAKIYQLLSRRMKKEEFIKLAPKCGYGSEDRARDYTERNPKMHYSVDDFIKLYHEPIDSMHWNGIRATKRLYEMYGINGRTTAKRNGVDGNDSSRQDWGM